MNRQGALFSQAPSASNSTIEASSEAVTKSASRLFFNSQWKLNAESAREEPRLRRLLGHVSVYDRTRALSQSRANPVPPTTTEENELSTYLQHEVPSFEEFRAALRVQLETIAQVRLAQCNEVDEFDSDEESDSSYDSFDGDTWSEEDTTAESDDSLTDNESEGQLSACTSPTFEFAAAKYDKETEEDDLWALRPLTPLLTRTNPVVSLS
ncbi:hypothetical protein H2200_007736 [Cladophialophora chaetospira]|uniref:Uncharacterized protein n=1 Tax=Cladophialophora chaetospira TaxID=386627 RepID=A0AA38X6T7_9EURO|nr:hypothetical protein H2200_007736 [Cladophialophora chaetospira]